MFIYTFVESKSRIPAYIQLCMDTWKKFLPRATIIIVDYKNVGDFIDVRDIGFEMFSKNLYTKQIEDIIKCAVLKKYGGCWLDADTIILNQSAESYFYINKEHKTLILSNTKDMISNQSYINTPPNSYIINYWYQYIREKVFNLDMQDKDWDYFSNRFLDRYIQESPDEIQLIEIKKFMPSILEETEYKNIGKEYSAFLFGCNYHLSDIDNNILTLNTTHISETFKNLSFENLLKSRCSLVNIFAELLDIKLPPIKD